MAKVAFMNIGVLREPFGHSQVRGFEQRIDDVFSAANGSPGFLNLLSSSSAEVPPLFQSAEFAGRVALTLSLWRDLESVFAYSYSGMHAEALTQRHHWFERGPWPGYVAWWIADDHAVTVAEAFERFEALHRDGSTPFAFNFKHPFTADAEPCQVNRDAVKAINAQTEIAALINNYLSAWNETDAAKRHGLLEQVWADDGQYTDPNAHASNRSELEAIIAAFQIANPDATFTLEDGIDQHHGCLRFYWTLRFQGGFAVSGMDYAELAGDKRLHKIVGFF